MGYSYHKDDDTIRKIVTLLREYCNSFEEYNSSSNAFAVHILERKIQNVLTEYYPYAAKVFNGIVVQVHELIENNDYIDVAYFEDDFIWIYNRIRQLEQRGTWDWETQEENDFDYYDSFGSSSSFIYDSPYEEFDEDERVRRIERQARRLAFQNNVDTVVKLIREHTKPVQRATLFANFKECTDKVITFACANEDILNYHGEYFWAGNLKISECKRFSLQNRVDALLRDQEIHHIDELFSDITKSFSSLLSEAYVQTSFQLLTLLKYLFPDRYNYLRPFVAQDKVKIPTIPERVVRFASHHNEIEIDDVIAFCKSKGITIAKLMDLFDNISDHFFIKNHSTLISVKMLALTSEVIEEIKEAIEEELEIDSYKAIRELKCLSKLPKLPGTVRWDEWLVYSIIRKHFKEIYTHTTSPQFRLAIPVVSLEKVVDKDALVEIAKRYEDSIDSGSVREVDDLDLIDELIDDMVEIDWEDIDDIEL